MKSPEEWVKEACPTLPAKGGCYEGILDLYKRIQLDAFKAGMTEAAVICAGAQTPENYGMADWLREKIEKARDKKT